MATTRKRKRPDLTEVEKWAVLVRYFLYFDKSAGELPGGAMDSIMEELSLSKSTINRTVKEYRHLTSNGDMYPSIAPKKPGRVGGLSQLTEVLADQILHFNSEEGYDMTIRHFTEEFNQRYGTSIPYSTMYSYTQKMHAVLRKSYLKPLLTPVHQICRMNFVLKKLRPDDMGNYVIMDIKYTIHVDEKWFFTQRPSTLYRTLANEKRHRDKTASSRGNYSKVMFLAAVGHPQYGPVPWQYFDGKIGLFPFVSVTQAQHNSKNRLRGTEVVECLRVDADQYFDVMTRPGGVIEMIKQKLPWLKESTITIQHDGASAHTGKHNELRLAEAGRRDGWHIVFERQPPHSPDTNILDLCLFNSMQKQAGRIRGGARNKQDLIHSVQDQWERYESATIERAFALLCEIYRKILEVSGDNQYDVPHSGITTRQRHGEEVADTVVSTELYTHAQLELHNLSYAPEAEEELPEEEEANNA